MNQTLLNISHPSSGQDLHPLEKQKKGSTAFQNLVLGLTQEGATFEGQTKPLAGRGGNPTGCAQKDPKGQSHFGTAPCKIFPLGGKIMGGKVVLSLLQRTQPKAASVPGSPSSPQKDRQNSERGGNPTGRPDGPLSPRVEPYRLGLLSFWLEGNRGKGGAADSPLNHPPLTSNSSLPPSLNAKLALTGVGFPDFVAWTGPSGSPSLQVLSPHLASSLRVQQAVQFGQGLLADFPPGGLKGKKLSPAVSLRGTGGGGTPQTANRLPPKRILSIVKPTGPDSPVKKGTSSPPPVKIEMREALPSQLTLILQSPRGEGPLRLEVNLSQVDSFLNRIALQSLKDAYGLKGKNGAVTTETKMDPVDQLHLRLSWEKGRISGEIIAPNPKVKRIIDQALSQVKKAFGQVGIEMDSLRASSPLCKES